MENNTSALPIRAADATPIISTVEWIMDHFIRAHFYASAAASIFNLKDSMKTAETHLCHPKTRHNTVSRQEHRTNEVGVVFPEYNHLSALNLYSALP